MPVIFILEETEALEQANSRLVDKYKVSVKL